MDNTQTPNSRVKVAVLNYMTALVREMQPQDLTAITLQTGPPGWAYLLFRFIHLVSWLNLPCGPTGLMMGLAGLGASISPQTAEAAIAKIVAWTSDVRSAEVRKAAQDALYALFSLHPGEVTRILSTLPKVCQVNRANQPTLFHDGVENRFVTLRQIRQLSIFPPISFRVVCLAFGEWLTTCLSERD